MLKHPEQSVAPSGFGGRADLKWACLPRVCWQPPPRWEVRPELEPLKPEPGTNWSFSYDQWLLSPWGGDGAQGAVAGALRELSFSPTCDGCDGGFYLGVHHSQGLRACSVLHFCAGFTFSQVHVTWSEVGSGSEGLLPHYSAGFALICYGYGISTPELIPLLPSVGRDAHADNGCLSLHQRQSQGPSWLRSPKCSLHPSAG